MISQLAFVNFQPEAECPNWLRFLERVMDGNKALIGFLQRAVGYTLTGRTSEQVLFLMLGSGANGKTTFLTTLRALMDEYAQQTPMDTLMVSRQSGNTNDLARLEGARFVSAVEAELGKQLAETKIKYMTGGDPITARYLYGEFSTFTPQFKLWLATNELPRIDSTDEGMWRRIRVIPFDVTIPREERDGSLPDKLKAELPGILSWAVQGCLDWQQQGLSPPPEVMSATNSYRSDMDVLAQWLGDTCVMAPDAMITAKEICESHKEWCETNGYEPLQQASLGRRLKTKGFKKKRTGKVRYWLGLRLATDEELLVPAAAE
jgi:putative DNA primase/helicase